ncbi:putative fimbrial protein [Citrobacter braakii]|uniref:fimbrial-like protein n=1 Tax=Citrobacter braakii TaxID=57706 RepID=UPI000E030419|nr:fimbrial-like protein [Citrobacter braakii]STH97244.1 putative fimbrial protein [Citrobacter braakii]
MFKKTLLAVIAASAFSGAVFNASAADQGHGKITFQGIVITAPCSIVPGDEDQTINLGQVADKVLNGDSKSRPVDVNIRLQDCVLTTGGTTIDKVKVTFSSANADSSTNLLKNTEDGLYGSATGAGVRLLTQSGANVVMGTEQLVNLVADNSNQVLTFKARMEAVATPGAVTPGNVKSDVNYVLAYN